MRIGEGASMALAIAVATVAGVAYLGFSWLVAGTVAIASAVSFVVGAITSGHLTAQRYQITLERQAQRRSEEASLWDDERSCMEGRIDDLDQQCRGLMGQLRQKTWQRDRAREDCQDVLGLKKKYRPRGDRSRQKGTRH